MYKTSTALFFYAETSVHAGSGESLGAIDLAIQRERHTDFPCVAAQGIKGAIRDWFEVQFEMPEDPDPKRLTNDQKKVLSAFGPITSKASEHAGAVAFTDARLLLFPVRSMRGVFAWISCPTALGRLKRDMAMVYCAGLKEYDVPDPGNGEALGGWKDHACLAGTSANARVVLEEEILTYSENNKVQEWAGWMRAHAIPDSKEYTFWQKRICPRMDESERSHLLVLHDDDFRHFVKTAIEVQARVKLGPKKTTTEDGNLFYQENLPPETVLYSLVLAADDLSGHLLKGDREARVLLEFIRNGGANGGKRRPGLEGSRLQIGGDETTGKGYVCARFFSKEATVAGQTQTKAG
jgi:CRISPR-associated protein Cmr4